MKKMIKAASVAGYILGVLCMDGAVDTGLKICGACTVVFLLCLHHDWIERERERKGRWIGFQRKG